MPDPIPNAPADEELSASDIADLAGVSPSAVSNWRKRYVDFPEPIGSAGRWVRFRSEEVLGWLAANDKLPEAVGPSTSIDDVLKEVVNRTRTTHDPLESLAVAGAFAATLVGYSRYWESVFADLFELFGQGVRALEGTEDLYSNLVLAEEWGGIEEIVDAVLRAADRIGTSTRNNDGATPPEVADFIAAAVAPSLGEHMEARRAEDVADVTPDAQKAFDNHYWLARSVYDPCAGVGRTLLRAAQEHESEGLGVSVFGQEINPGAARVASLVNRLNMAEETDIVVGNSLQQDHFPDRKADLVVAHPPFGLRLPDGLGDDPRWILGNPGRDGSSAWIQIALSKLSERGRAAVVVEPSWAFRGGPSRELRAALVRQNLLDGVIALPRGTFLPGTNIGGLLVLLAKDRSNREPAREPGEVLFVDWSLPTDVVGPPPTAGQSFQLSTWKDCFANWRDLGEPLASSDSLGLELLDELATEILAEPIYAHRERITREFVGRHAGQDAVMAQVFANRLSMVFAQQATYEDIAGNDFDFTPKRYMVFNSALTQGVVESFEEESNRAVLIAEEATTSAKAAVAAMKPLAVFYAGQQPDQAPTMRLTTLGELQTAGQIEMIAGRGTGRTTNPAASYFGPSEDAPSEGAPRMLTSSWIRDKASGKTLETHTLVTKSAKIPRDSLVKPGDVIFAIADSDSGQTAVWTATVAELGAALGFGLYAIRINVDSAEPPELTADFVAAWCRTGHLSHQVQRLSTGDVLPKLRWRDLQRIEIPVPADAAAHDWFMKQMGLHADLRTSHENLSLLVENLSNLESRFLDSLIASAESDEVRFEV